MYYFSTILPLVIRGKKLERLYLINNFKGNRGNKAAKRRADKYLKELEDIRAKIQELT